VTVDERVAARISCTVACSSSSPTGSTANAVIELTASTARSLRAG